MNEGEPQAPAVSPPELPAAPAQPAGQWGEYPVGAPTMSTTPRVPTWRKIAVGAGLLVAVFGVVGRFALAGSHSSGTSGGMSDVARQYRAAVDTMATNDHFGASLGDSELNARAGLLTDFDNKVRDLSIPASAEADRQALLDADSTYESTLQQAYFANVPLDEGQLNSAQQAHVDAVNALAHDLGLPNILRIVDAPPP